MLKPVFYHAASGFEQSCMNTQAQSVCMGVDAQSLLVAATSDLRRKGQEVYGLVQVAVGFFEYVITATSCMLAAMRRSGLVSQK